MQRRATAERNIKKSSLTSDSKVDDGRRVELLDQVEQEKIVKEMNEQANRQEREIYNTFRIVCIAASFISLMVAANVHLGGRVGLAMTLNAEFIVRFLHAFLSGWLHCITPRVCEPGQETKQLIWRVYPFIGANFTVAFLGYFSTTVILDGSDVVSFVHPTLLLGNAITLALACFIRWEAANSRLALHELQSSMYRFKSL